MLEYLLSYISEIASMAEARIDYKIRMERSLSFVEQLFLG